MWKLFLLICMAWLRGFPGAGGLGLLLMFFLYCAYSIRYRGYHGRLANEEVEELRLHSDVDTRGMREQWDVIPWPGTSKHVVRKWTWDRIALDTRIRSRMKECSAGLDAAYKALRGHAAKSARSATTSQYSGTLAVIDPLHRRSHSPKTALALLKRVYEDEKKVWTNRAICTLGGTFVICAEAFKKDAKEAFGERRVPRMKSGTVAETSRITWKAGQIFLNFGRGSLESFFKALFARINPWDAHAVIQYEKGAYYAPTTMFGASATIMKVMNLCEALELDDQQKIFVGYSVAMHWIDKYLNDDTWICGGVFTPDRHSLIEALQGMYAYIEDDPEKAARELARMYEEADEARSKDENQ